MISTVARTSLQLFLVAILTRADALNDCAQRYYNHDSFVCVCNATHCDTIEPLPQLRPGDYATYTTSRDHDRLTRTSGKLKVDAIHGNWFNRCKGIVPIVSLCINPNIRYQEIIGFGGSFTDAAGININSLSSETGEKLMEAYFTDAGLQYVLGRVPIGGADFSTRPYTYDDDHPGDFDLLHFKLQKEDYEYKIPLIHKAEKLKGSKLTLVASPWSAPAWMKTGNSIRGMGFLKGKIGDKYYQAWAEYYLKFLKAYEKLGVTFWAITAQNEPTDGFNPFFPFNCMGFSPKMQRIFVNTNLGPTLEKSGYGEVKIFVLDDNRPLLLFWMSEIMRDTRSEKYVRGAALHWYLDFLAPASVYDIAHHLYPNKTFLMTETSFLELLNSRGEVKLGSWERGAEYTHSMIQNLNHWISGWIDWNLALDSRGGPNWANMYLDAAIITNQTNDEFYKQPHYYIIGHFSKFVPPGSFKIHTDQAWLAQQKGISSIAFWTPESNIVLIILNRSSSDVSIDVNVNNFGNFKVMIHKASIQTIVFKPQ